MKAQAYYKKQWYLRNKDNIEYRERVNKNARIYNSKHQDRKRILVRNWRHKNPLNVRVHNLRRRAHTATLTVEIIQRVYENNIKKYKTLTCYLCLRPIKFGEDSIDHKIPLSKGGTNEYDNLEIAHRRCNSRKGSSSY